MKEPYPRASISVPEGTAKRWVWVFSVIVFLAVVVLDRVQVPTSGTWDVHVFARINAVINTVVSLLLLVGLFAAKAGRWGVHRTVMLGAILLSVLFLISYIMHHEGGVLRAAGPAHRAGCRLIALHPAHGLSLALGPVAAAPQAGALGLARVVLRERERGGGVPDDLALLLR
jgi:uncharacterized membrane protein YozB (DUF420 family)